MKVVILAGGKGYRLSEETLHTPKPIVNIGEKPMLWHIMKYFSCFGFNDFIVCGGYKFYLIKEFYANYWMHNSDILVNTASNVIRPLKPSGDSWEILMVDTGLDTETGGRLLRLKDHIKDDTFIMTYGDGLADINLSELVNFHKLHGRLATVTGVKTPGRFGVLNTSGETVKSFSEKTDTVDSWVSGGFFVLSKKVLNYIDHGDETVWEKSPLERLAGEDQLRVYKHHGNWKCMDTLRDKIELEEKWKNNQAFWKVW